MNALSPLMVTPRLVPMPPSLRMPSWRASLYVHSCRPVVASSAYISFHPVTYMMPSCTTGVD